MLQNPIHLRLERWKAGSTSLLWPAYANACTLIRRILSANRLRRWADLPPHSDLIWETLTVKDAKVNFDSQLRNLKKRFLQPTISICTAFIRNRCLRGVK